MDRVVGKGNTRKRVGPLPFQTSEKNPGSFPMGTKGRLERRGRSILRRPRRRGGLISEKRDGNF